MGVVVEPPARHEGIEIGRQRVEFEAGDGNDIIADFTNGVDLLDCSDFSEAVISAAISALIASGPESCASLATDSPAPIFFWPQISRGA